MLISPITVRKKYLPSYFAFKPNHKPSEIGRRQWSYLLSAQIAIIGPILYQRYLRGYNHQEILNKIGFFENIPDIIRWNNFLFDKLTSISATYNENPLNSSWWYDNWGVNADLTDIDEFFIDSL